MSKQHDTSAMPATTDWAKMFAQKLIRCGIVQPEKAHPVINRRTAYHVYRDMGPTRSLGALLQALKAPGWDGEVSVAQLQTWSTVEDWPRACAAWDADQAAAGTFDGREAFEKLAGKVDAKLFSVLDEQNAPKIDTEAVSALFDLRLVMSERIGVLEKRGGADTLETDTDHCDLEKIRSPTLVPSYAFGPHDRPQVHDQVEEARQNDDSANNVEPYEHTLHDAAGEEGGSDNIDCEDELGLADLVGCKLPSLPEKYRHTIGPGDGRIRCVWVSNQNGYVVLNVNTDKPAWFTVETRVRCR